MYKNGHWEAVAKNNLEIAPLCMILDSGNKFLEKMRCKPSVCGVPIVQNLDRYFGPISDKKTGGILRDLTLSWMGKAQELQNIRDLGYSDMLSKEKISPHEYYDNIVSKAGFLVVQNVNKNWGMLGKMHENLIKEATFRDIAAFYLENPTHLYISSVSKPKPESKIDQVVSRLGESMVIFSNPHSSRSIEL
jgi:hypothetical protein